MGVDAGHVEVRPFVGLAVGIDAARGQHASWLGIPGPPVPTYSCHSALVSPRQVEGTGRGAACGGRWRWRGSPASWSRQL